MNKFNKLRGYFGIGIFNTKTKVNLGTLWRSAHNFNAEFIFTIGRRYKKQCSDTTKAYRHIPLFNFETFECFSKSRPYNCILVGIEQSKKSIDIKYFQHPERCIYLLGSEDNGLPNWIQDRCQKVIHISSPMSLNVAVAGSIIMFDRLQKL